MHLAKPAFRRLLLLGFSAAATALWAQSEAGSATLSGTASDPSGAAVAGARVVVSNSGTGLARELFTSEAGLYTAVRLPAGSYSVSVERTGFKTARRENIALNVGSYVTFDFKLELGSATESVTVSGEVPLVEASRSQTSTVVNEKAVRDLPINGRNFLDFTILSPGVVRDPRTGDLSFGGQRGPFNSLLVDGMDANSAFWGQSVGRAGFRNPYSFSQDAVQEFQVNTNSFAAEIGRATGGVVNVITKSGTNQFHGTGFWFYRDRAMNANTFFNNRAGIARQPYHFNQFGGNLGGPIVRNRLFFFYNYDAQRNTTPNAIFFPIAAPSDALSQQAVRELSRYLTPYTTGQKNDIHTAKIDWNATRTQALSVRFNAHRFLGTNLENPGPQSANERTGDSILDTDNWTATHTWTIGSNKVFDQRFIYLREDNPSTANGEGPEVVVRQSGVNFMQFGRANFLPRFVTQDKYGVVQTLSWTKGRHSFKFGHDLKLERSQQLNSNLFFGQYTFDSLADFASRRPSSFAQAFAGPGTTGGLTFPDANEWAAFAQDSWRVTQRLTLNYGVRYDLFAYRGNDIRNADPALRAAGYQTGVMPRDRNDFAGRFGFAYRLDNAGRYVVRGGIGTYYGRLLGLVSRTIQAQNGIQISTLTLTGAAMPSYPAVFPTQPAVAGAVPDIFVMQPDFRTPLTHQSSLNVEARLAKDFSLTLGYLGVRGNRLTRIRDINHFPYEQLTGRFASGESVNIFRRPNARPNRAFGRISLLESGSDSTYHGGFLQLTKRYATGFQLLASYTLAKTIDSAPDATSFIPNSGGEDVKLVQDTLAPNNDRGRGEADIRHRMVASGVWDVLAFDRYSNPAAKLLLRGWQISSIVSLQSGRPFSERSNVDLNNDGNRFTDRMPGVGRNTRTGPGFASVDLRVSKEVPVWREKVKLRLMGEAFNAFNRANFTTVQQVPFNYNATTRTFTPVATFGQATNTADPRILQLAARITF
jgi:outer membrane receptor protein involved in Fe transport